MISPYRPGFGERPLTLVARATVGRGPSRLGVDELAERTGYAAAVMHDDARGKQESRNAGRAEAADSSAATASTSEGQDRQAPATPAEESVGHPPQTARGAA